MFFANMEDYADKYKHAVSTKHFKMIPLCRYWNKTILTNL